MRCLLTHYTWCQLANQLIIHRVEEQVYTTQAFDRNITSKHNKLGFRICI